MEKQSCDSIQSIPLCIKHHNKHHNKLIHHIWHHFIRDNYCLDSIILLYADITIYVYICIIRSALSLCQWGKEPLFNRYISRHTNISLTETCLTNQSWIGLCPHKVDLPAINLAAHDIYDQLIQSIQYNHTLWP